MGNFGYLILRLFFGGIFLMHGLQMLGAFSGTYLKGATLTTERERFRPVWLWASLLAYGNLFAGLSLLLGAFTVLGSALVVTVIVVVLVTSDKIQKGFWNKDKGYEYTVSLIGGGLAMGFFGPGPLSVDAVLMPGLISPSLFLFTLIVVMAIAALGLLTRGAAVQEAAPDGRGKRNGRSQQTA